MWTLRLKLLGRKLGSSEPLDEHHLCIITIPRRLECLVLTRPFPALTADMPTQAIRDGAQLDPIAFEITKTIEHGTTRLP
jgi:hypothetical protein